MCFDKTGTLTEDKMDVLGLRIVKFSEDDLRLGRMLKEAPNNINNITLVEDNDLIMLRILSCCHSLVRLQTGVIIGQIN